MRRGFVCEKPKHIGIKACAQEEIIVFGKRVNSLTKKDSVMLGNHQLGKGEERNSDRISITPERGPLFKPIFYHIFPSTVQVLHVVSC
jgi:hypothetical protein